MNHITKTKARSSALEIARSGMDSFLVDQFAYRFAYKDGGSLQVSAMKAYRDLLISRVIWEEQRHDPEYVQWANDQIDQLIEIVGDE